MNVSIVGRHIDITDAMRVYIDSALDALKLYHLDLISARVIIANEEKNGKKGVVVEFAINLAHKNTIVIKQKDKDFYAAIDLAVDRAKKVLGRYHDRITEHKVEKPENIEAQKIISEEIAEAYGSDDEIVPMELELYKPFEIEEALEKLKNNPKQQFYVFNDMDGKMRVLYKRSDGADMVFINL